MTELSFGTSMKTLHENRYGKVLEIAVLGLITGTLLSVVAGLAGSVWLTLLMGLLAYTALVVVLFAVRRILRAHRWQRDRSRR